MDKRAKLGTKGTAGARPSKRETAAWARLLKLSDALARKFEAAERRAARATTEGERAAILYNPSLKGAASDVLKLYAALEARYPVKGRHARATSRDERR